jgi:ribosomal protein S18 acetylase RimI-like enzyme
MSACGRGKYDVPMVETRVLTADDWRLWRGLRLAALEESPDAFGSKLADWQGDGDREERWRNRLTAVPFNVIVLDGERPVGMVSGADDGDDVELISMYVHPSARGRGVSDLLIEAVVERAADRGAQRVWLSVRTTNEQALALYRRHHFAEVGPAPSEPDEPPEVLMSRPTALG